MAALYLQVRKINDSGAHPTDLHTYQGPIWSGWDTVDKLFVFGDSWSDTHFDPYGAQPSAENPFGNPTFPEGRSDGPLWLDFLTQTYNKSLVRTHVLARGGAVVDHDVVRGLWSRESLSFREQLDHIFRPVYASTSVPEQLKWDPQTTLFAVQFGVNDLSVCLQTSTRLPVQQIISSYGNIVESLYGVGARNFLFVNVPLLNLAIKDLAGTLRADTYAYNEHLVFFKHELTSKHQDITAFLFDTYGFYDWLLQRHRDLPQTVGLRNLSDTCDAYSFGGKDSDNSQMS